MRTTGRAGLVCLLAAVALAGTGCNGDGAEPTAPEDAQAAFTPDAGVKQGQRSPYIAKVEIPSGTTVQLGDGGTPYFVTLTNPGPKTATGLFVHGYLEQNGLSESVGATFIECYQPPGTLPARAPCTITWHILAAWPTQFVGGPAIFTLKLMQRSIDNSIKELDRVTVDVVIA